MYVPKEDGRANTSNTDQIIYNWAIPICISIAGNAINKQIGSGSLGSTREETAWKKKLVLGM